MLPMNNGWIDIDDAVPGHGNNVLVLLETFKIKMAFYDNQSLNLFHYSHDFENDEEILELIENKYDLPYPIIQKVTHWMPLPKLPNNKD